MVKGLGFRVQGLVAGYCSKQFMEIFFLSNINNYFPIYLFKFFQSEMRFSPSGDKRINFFYCLRLSPLSASFSVFLNPLSPPMSTPLFLSLGLLFCLRASLFLRMRGQIHSVFTVASNNCVCLICSSCLLSLSAPFSLNSCLFLQAPEPWAPNTAAFPGANDPLLIEGLMNNLFAG